MKLFHLLCCLLPVATQAQVDTTQRPAYHFTAAKNWINDPNGLIYINGQYHLYYQYNPYDTKWGHMSWGHAVSKDLLHWNDLPVAIPEVVKPDTTTWIFSGSAVLDKANTSGFGKNAIVAIYTADQPTQQKESQFIAYSNDGGLTYRQYAGNPVIDLHKKDFRDPNVIWLEKQKHWLMTVALPQEKKVQFYRSDDLKHWTLLSEFGNQGDTRKIWECPSLTPLHVDGDPKKTKWLLMVSSGNQDGETGLQYFTGDFDGKEFKNDNAAAHQQFVDLGPTFYAAIPYNNLPDGKKTMIGWLMPSNQPAYPWTGSMSIPRDLALKSTPQGVRLFQQPSSVIKLPASKFEKKDVAIKDQPFVLEQFKNNTNWIDVTFSAGTAKTYGVKLPQAEITCHGGELVIAWKDGKKKLSVPTGDLRLQLLQDKSSVEVFVNGGAQVVTFLVYPAKEDHEVSLFAKQGSVKVKSLKVWELQPL